MKTSSCSRAFSSAAEIAEALLSAREKKGWLSNCYLTRDVLKKSTEQMVGYGQDDSGLYLIIRDKEDDKLLLCFDPACKCLLHIANTGHPMIVNWPARRLAMDALQEQVTSLLTAEGFCFYARYKRMKLRSRISAPEPREDWILSRSADPKAVCALWTASLDSYAVDLPSVDECEAFIREGAVLSILDTAGELVASMLVRREGSRITLEHISVRPDNRRKGLGGYLVRECLAGLPPEAYVQLWVNIENTPAAALYDHLGFADDGLVSCQWLRRA